jgi:uncharacterized membrane-anchored protein
LTSELDREGALMSASKKYSHGQQRRGLSTLALGGIAIGVVSLFSSAAGASSRQGIVVATSSSSAGVLLVLGGAVLVLGGISFVVFTYTRRKRRPNQCAAQQDALDVAEKAVRYWEAARAHLEAVERERTVVDGTANEESTHASLVANADAGLKAAMKQRDECQMELIRCMASGVPAVPVIPTAQVPVRPFFTPETEGPSSSTPNS